MTDHPVDAAGRRRFLSSGLRAALGGLVGTTAWAHLASRPAHAGDANYRAVVCVYLSGGNDSFNMLVPTDSASRTRYAAARGGLAVPAAGLQALAPRTAQPGGRSVAFHPAMRAALDPLFDAGRLALVSNIGTLVQPVTRADIEGGAAPLPADLFSHEQQTVQWQTVERGGVLRGWGGRLCDYAAAQNTLGPGSAITVGGQTPLLAGDLISAFAVRDTGEIAQLASAGSALDRLTGYADTRANLLEQAYAAAHDRLRQGAGALASAIAPASAVPPPPGGDFPRQLQTIARIIAGRATLGARRQVFWCQLGSFDTHADQAIRHPALLTELAAGLAWFDAALDGLGVRESVTTFTASDFGRNLFANGDGTDHGWGGHQLVLGGAVNGRDIYGPLPSLASGSTDLIGDNQMIPYWSSDQLGASLGRWLGLTDAQLREVFPRLAGDRFPSLTIGSTLPLLRA